jgi:ethanolamine utilization protein EutJ
MPFFSEVPPMRTDLSDYLASAEAVFNRENDGNGGYCGPVRVGVDLGTAYTVLVVLDAGGQPLAGAYRFSQVVRDGLVVDFMGAVNLLRELKVSVEERLALPLVSAATAYPPGVSRAEVRATGNVLVAAGLDCDVMVDEPTAANAVLGLRDGAVVDVGGGTTGVAVIQDGRVRYTADEPTGGTHFSLVIAGALDLSFEAAEVLKRDPGRHRRLFPLVRPVMEKVGSIAARHIRNHHVETIYLVGGTACFSGIAGVVEAVTGIRTVVPALPLFITPLGIALHNNTENAREQ